MSLTLFKADYYYGFIVFIIPLIYCVITANKLVVRLVGDSSFACLLMAPVSRRKIIVTKGICLLFSIALLFALLHTASGWVCRILFGDMLNRRIFLRLNLNAALLTTLVGMICFFYSNQRSVKIKAELIDGGPFAVGQSLFLRLDAVQK